MEGTIYLNKKSNKSSQDIHKNIQNDSHRDMNIEEDTYSNRSVSTDNNIKFTEYTNHESYKPVVEELLPEDDSYEIKPEDWEKENVWKPGFLEIEDKLDVKEKQNEEKYEDKNNRDGGLSEPFKKYLKKFKEAVVEENRKSTNPIVVDEIASKVAKFYEVIRRVVDWKEAHLIRRTAIERMLKRRFVSKIYGISILHDVDPKEAAEPFVLELVRSGYFPNGKIAKEKIFEIQKVLERYLYVLSNATIKNGDDGNKSKREVKASIKKKINFYNWVIETAACEIEEVLSPPLKERALLDLMTECLYQRIKFVPDGGIPDDVKYLQSYISVHRTLFNLDAPIISYHILKYKYPDFFISDDFTSVFTEKALDIWQGVEEDLSYKKSAEFYRIAEKYDAAYLMIWDSLEKLEKDIKTIDEKVFDSATLLSLVETSYNERLTTLKSRLLKLAIFSTLSIFVAGGASLLIFEIPVAKFVRGYFSPIAILADIAIPTALMFILVWMIRPPSGNNIDVVKEEVLKIVYKVNEIDVYEIRLNKKIRKIVSFIFALIYIAGGLASMYFIYWIFKIADVPWTSLYINTINVAMIVFSAMVIRQRSKELTIIEKANIVEFILDFFSIPLAKMGGWFSKKWKEYNIVSVFFIALIDFPFSSFVATIEGWRNFIKEKRSEIH